MWFFISRIFVASMIDFSHRENDFVWVFLYAWLLIMITSSTRPQKIDSSKSSIISEGLVNMITGENRSAFLVSDIKNLEMLLYLIENVFPYNFTLQVSKFLLRVKELILDSYFNSVTCILKSQVKLILLNSFFNW